MKFIKLSSIVILFALAACALPANAQNPPIKIVMSPRQTVPLWDIEKNINEKCPNVKIVLDSRKSDYMLEALGWSGSYHFTLFRKGGEVVFGTNTVMLSNAIKDVCKYMNAHGPVTAQAAGN
jgi:hypothetical protein